MSVVQTLTLAPVAAINWARANGHKELLSVLMPYEDPETLDDIWARPDSVKDTTVAEIDYKSEGGF